MPREAPLVEATGLVHGLPASIDQMHDTLKTGEAQHLPALIELDIVVPHPRRDREHLREGRAAARAEMRIDDKRDAALRLQEGAPGIDLCVRQCVAGARGREGARVAWASLAVTQS